MEERERERGSTQGFLRPRHIVTWHTVLLPHPVGQSKSQGQPGGVEGDGLYCLVGRAAESHDKRCGYRKGWRIRAIFSIRLAWTTPEGQCGTQGFQAQTWPHLAPRPFHLFVWLAFFPDPTHTRGSFMETTSHSYLCNSPLFLMSFCIWHNAHLGVRYTFVTQTMGLRANRIEKTK